MPLIEIRRRPYKIDDQILESITRMLPVVAAAVLSCSEGGVLKPADIMIEVNDFNSRDKNVKDISIRVIAHDYPERRGKNLATLDLIRKRISREVVERLPERISWYVWVLLVPTSYGSDTET